jgi:NAD(P)-dependent dehydrogenase (short-subunit alcohol dehydrogenase family)
MKQTKALNFVVTGAANGIGMAIHQLIESHGHQVFMMDRQSMDSERFIYLDLMNVDSIEKAAESLPKSINGLINCAGIAPQNDNQLDILNINWLGTKLLTTRLNEKLSPNGSVTTIASRAGAGWKSNYREIRSYLKCNTSTDLQNLIQSAPMTPARAYELSKEILIAWTQMMAASQQLVRYNSVSPSSVETRLTPLFRSAFQSRSVSNRKLVSRITKPDEVAAAAWFLASPTNQSIQGIDLKVDNGVTAIRDWAEIELLESDNGGKHDVKN